MGSIDIIKPLTTFLQPVPWININNIEINFHECQESNLGPPGAKRECYLCTMLPPSFLAYFKLDTMFSGEFLSRGHSAGGTPAVPDQGVRFRHRQQADHQLLALPDPDRVYRSPPLDRDG